MVGKSDYFPGHDHALPWHYLSDWSAPTEAQSRSSRRVAGYRKRLPEAFPRCSRGSSYERPLKGKGLLRSHVSEASRSGEAWYVPPHVFTSCGLAGWSCCAPCDCSVWFHPSRCVTLLFRDGDARHAGSWDLCDGHLKELRQELERFAVPASLRAGRIHRIVASMRFHHEVEFGRS